MSTTNSAILVCVSTLSLAGCVESEPQRVQVAGRVEIDGEPLSMGTIRLVPGGGRPVSGEIQADGSFTLASAGQGGLIPGVVPGLYRVAVSSSEILDEDTGPIWHAPAKYANHRTSGIEVVIDEPTTSLVIALESETSDDDTEEDTSESGDSEPVTDKPTANET